jgi:hypothetical protein
MSEFYSKDRVKSILKSEEPWLAHGVPIDALETIIKYYVGKERKHIAFLVVESKTGKVLNPKEYQLYAEALDYDGNLGMLEQFPPVIWP